MNERESEIIAGLGLTDEQIERSGIRQFVWRVVNSEVALGQADG